MSNLYGVSLLDCVRGCIWGEEGENVTEYGDSFIGDGVQVPGEERFRI
jgi:hypothetical protein